MNGLHGDGVFQHVRVPLVLRYSCLLGIGTKKPPEVLAGDLEKPLIRSAVWQEFRYATEFVEQRLIVCHERVRGSQAALEPLNCNVVIMEVIWRECNDFGRSEAMPEGHEKHEPIPRAVCVRSSQDGQKFVAGEALNAQKESKNATLQGIVT